MLQILSIAISKEFHHQEEKGLLVIHRLRQFQTSLKVSSSKKNLNHFRIDGGFSKSYNYG